MLITIGAFDGFHKGHEELLRICRENTNNDDWIVVTFYPHPAQFMHKFSRSLFTLKERKLICKMLNIPDMYVLKFDENMKNLSPEGFWQLLNSKFKIDGVVMGSDFHFGYKRSGDAKYLEMLAKKQGINNIYIVDVLNKSSYSSSNVRAKISKGDITGANDILGYPWFMIGKVVHGNGRGRTMKFPTANLDISNDKIIPADGVYATAILIDKNLYCGALSIGKNPTFNDINETRIEAHILDFEGNIYEDEILAVFLDRLRDTKKFHDKESLMAQIAKDAENSKKIYEERKRDVNRFALSYKF